MCASGEPQELELQLRGVSMGCGRWSKTDEVTGAEECSVPSAEAAAARLRQVVQTHKDASRVNAGRNGDGGKSSETVACARGCGAPAESAAPSCPTGCNSNYTGFTIHFFGKHCHYRMRYLLLMWQVPSSPVIADTSQITLSSSIRGDVHNTRTCI